VETFNGIFLMALFFYSYIEPVLQYTKPDAEKHIPLQLPSIFTGHFFKKNVKLIMVFGERAMVY